MLQSSTTNNTNLTNGTGAVWNSPDERVGCAGSDNHSVIHLSVIYSFDSWLSCLLVQFNSTYDALVLKLAVRSKVHQQRQTIAGCLQVVVDLGAVVVD